MVGLHSGEPEESASQCFEPRGIANALVLRLVCVSRTLGPSDRSCSHQQGYALRGRYQRARRCCALGELPFRLEACMCRHQNWSGAIGESRAK